MNAVPFRMGVAFIVSLAVSGLLAPLIYRFLIRVKSRQTISEHVAEHAHKQGTPTMGGLITLAGFFAGTLICFPQTHTKVPLLLCLAYGLIGFFDDYVVPRMLSGKRGLGWKQKLIMQVGLTIAILLLYSHNVTEVAILTFLVLFFSNAYNFADGMDGLAGSLALVLALAIAVIAGYSGSEWILPHIMLALVGGLIPFLYYNAPPARVFMGDVGALPIGALLGFSVGHLLLRGSVMAPTLWFLPLCLLMLVLIVELVPVPIQIASVKLRGKRVFPKTPIHHAFQDAGWPETRVVSLFVLSQLVCAGLAIIWTAILAGVLK
ncbi:MAG: hypothetical protein JNM85_05835 [Chthonomonas sp.]|nr:hypothetical protein [Chthonomonas sp.]